jgi:hypothetical protein
MKKSIMRQENSMKKENNRATPYVLLAILVAVIFFYTYSIEKQQTPYAERYIPCIELFQKDLLYQGQPLCGQGPMVFIIGWVVNLFTTTHLQEVMLLLSIILALAITYLVISLADVKNTLLKIAVGAAVFLVFYDVALLKTEMLLASFFVMLSFYLDKKLGDKDLARKYGIIGFVQALSLLSKMTVAIIYVAYYAYPFLLNIMTTKKENTQSLIKKTAIAAGVIVLVLLFVFVKYHNVFDYSLFIHEDMKNRGIERSWEETASRIGSGLFTLDNGSTFLIASYILALLYFFMKKDSFAFIYLFLVPAMFLINKQTSGVTLLLNSNYLIFFYLIFLVFFLRMLQGSEQKNLLLIGLLLFLLFSPKANLNTLEFKNQLAGQFDKELITDFFMTLPAIEKTAVDTDLYPLLSDEYKSKISSDHIFDAHQNQWEGGLIATDDNQLLGLKRRDILDESIYNPYANKELQRYKEQNEKIENILAAKPNVILLNPFLHESNMFRILTEKGLLNEYCGLRLPYLPTNDARGGMIALYKDKDRCLEALKQADAYFRINFDRICQKDEWVADFVVANTLKQNYDFNMQCSSGKFVYPEARPGKIYLLFSNIFLLVWAFFLLKRVRLDTLEI